MAYPGEALIIKMLESLGDKGIGSLLRPWQIRREGKALIDVRVEEKLRLAQAEQDAEAILKGEATLSGATVIKLPSGGSVEVMPPENMPIQVTAANPVIKKIASTYVADTIRKEVNIAKAILEAEAELENDTQLASDKPLEDDWLYRWRDYASEVSNEELQGIWGKVLAGETKSPGSFSLRTLEFIRTLSQREAQEISRLAPFVVSGIIYRNNDWLTSAGVTFEVLLRAQEMGILSGVDGLGLQQTYSSLEQGRFVLSLICYDKVLIVEHDDQAKQVSLQCCVLTAVGREVLGLCKVAANEAYLKNLGQYFLTQGFKVRLANIRHFAGNKIQYYNPEEIKLSTTAEVVSSSA